MFVDRMFFQNKSARRIAMVLCAVLFSINSFAQPQNKEQEKELKAAQNYLSEAQQALQKDKFPEAEADYRKAISLNPKSETAKIQSGHRLLRKRKKNAEAMLRFKQAATTATSKAEKTQSLSQSGEYVYERKKNIPRLWKRIKMHFATIQMMMKRAII